MLGLLEIVNVAKKAQVRETVEWSIHEDFLTSFHPARIAAPQDRESIAYDPSFYQSVMNSCSVNKEKCKYSMVYIYCTVQYQKQITPNFKEPKRKEKSCLFVKSVEKTVLVTSILLSSVNVNS